KARAADINRTKWLVVGNVKYFPAQLQLLFFTPRHCEGLAQTKICIPITWNPEPVARAGFAWIGVTETLIDGLNIAATKQLGCAGSARASADRTSRSHIRLHVPVRSPASVIIGRRCFRKAAVVTENASQLPSAQHRFCE